MRAVLDANVLFPTILREILTDLAQAGLYHALWSDRILEEWHRAAALRSLSYLGRCADDWHPRNVPHAVRRNQKNDEPTQVPQVFTPLAYPV